MPEIAIEEFEKWLINYGSAWEAGYAQAAIKLFSENAEYFENPFDEPMVGLEAIHRYWSERAGESQKDIRFQHRAVAVVANTGLAQWEATFTRLPSGNQVELNGFLMAEFDATGRCSVFREWWHRREEGSIQAS